MKKFFTRILPVIIGAVVITALGIDASDTLKGQSGTMLGQLIATDNRVCPDGMVQIPAATSFTCIDQYEASAHEDCPVATPQGPDQTQTNIVNLECKADSKAGVEPWRFITREQAAAACARAGKRLPKAGEWYSAALGAIDADNNCNTDSNKVEPGGSYPDCVSAAGVYDLIGNVWEWVSDDVVDGQHNGQPLPKEGYVGQVDGKGIPTLTSDGPSDLFYKDYFWSDSVGVFGMLRGGFYGSEEDAGIYSVHAKTAPTSLGTAIGFRCVK